ncbi:MAG: threonine/homoserine/homoserine lactone efflux protein [Oceanicoccus sp.]|jgi:threonine/homoserine/homoserine lactone efflux protein
MPTLNSELIIFALAALIMVLSPGPNMIYLVSRTICHGQSAGLFSLLGVIAGFIFHIILVAFGLSAILFAVPFTYFIIKWTGALYLLYLAWNSFKAPNAKLFENKSLKSESRLTLFKMGLITNILNPKVALFYMSLLPQFIDPELGYILGQSLTLGLIQLSISATVNFCIVFGAAKCANFLKNSPRWIKFQQRFMGSVLSYLAVKLAISENPVT